MCWKYEPAVRKTLAEEPKICGCGAHVLDLMCALAGTPESCFAALYEGKQRALPEQIWPGNEGLGPLLGNRVDATSSLSERHHRLFQFAEGGGRKPESLRPERFMDQRVSSTS